MMADSNEQLDEFFSRYRAACPEPEPSAGFMPGLWQKIEARRSFAFTFEHMAKPLMTVLAALCLLLLVLNLTNTGQANLTAPTYTDALAADTTAERTDYAEALHNVTPVLPAAPQAPETRR